MSLALASFPVSHCLAKHNSRPRNSVIAARRSLPPWFGVYVHYPHCRNACGYCEFPKVRSASFPVEAYTEAVLAELRQRAAPYHSWQLASIFFGGGTPSLWAPGQLRRVIDGVLELFSRRSEGGGLCDTVEVTIEANPETVGPALLERIQAAGVNRLSLGVQSLDDEALAGLTRCHSAQTARQAVCDSVAAGLNVSCDLIFGYRDQSVEHHLDQLRAVVRLQPQHVSTYALTLSERSTLRRQGYRPVSDDLSAEMMQKGRALLEAEGLAQYEVSNYARPGQACLHNSHVWLGQPYLGLGAWAHSLVPAADGSSSADGGWFRQANPPLQQYLLGSAQGVVEPLDRIQARQEVLILGLRTVAGVDRDLYRTRFGQDVVAELELPIRELERLGLLQVGEKAVQPTRRGIWFADEIALRLMG